MLPSHVLVPFDGSPLAGDALTEALARFECRVTVLNVVTPVDAGMSESGVLEADQDRYERAQQRANAVVDAARRRADAEDRSIDTAVESGDPAEVILEYIDDHGVDRVVMGGHGGERNAVVRRLLGTVATRVVGEAPVTVTVVR